jgi:AmmeMemoRadiSam system protein B
MLSSFLTAPTAPMPRVKALIAPHAGYVYSGAVAGKAYGCLESRRGEIRRVVLIGPAHRVPFRGSAVSTADAFQTPLGTVVVDQDVVARLLTLDSVQALDHAHQHEHALEVHLPFLQTVLDDFQLVPLLVGSTSDACVAEALEAAWGGPETLIVVSSDLSHFLSYDSAVAVDRRTANAIERLNLRDVGPEQACGFLPIRGLLRVARQRDLQVRRVALQNSGDTEGTHQQVVGYGAFLVEEAAST